MSLSKENKIFDDIIRSADEFTCVYRSSKFCTYTSSTKFVKIGDDSEYDVSHHFISEAEPHMPRLLLFKKGSNGIPTKFCPLTSMSVSKTMLVFERLPNETRLCDIDTQNWSLETRVSCLKLIMQAIYNLLMAGVHLKNETTPGTVSLYTNSEGETIALCDSENLTTNTDHIFEYEKINKAVRFLSYYLNINDLPFQLHDEDIPTMFVRANLDDFDKFLDDFEFDEVDNLYTLPKSPVKIDFVSKPNTLDRQVFECQGEMLHAHEILCLPIVLHGFVDDRQTLHMYNKNYLIEVRNVSEDIIKSAEVLRENMDSSLPLCYFVPEQVVVLENTLNAFVNFNSSLFVYMVTTPTQFVYNRETMGAMVTLQQHKSKTTTLRDFLDSNPRKDMRVFAQKIMVLWCKLASIGLVCGENISFDNIFLKKSTTNRKISTQLPNEEIFSFTDTTSKIIDLTFDCRCNYDIYIDLNNLHIEKWDYINMTTTHKNSAISVVAFCMFYMNLFERQQCKGGCYFDNSFGNVESVIEIERLADALIKKGVQLSQSQSQHLNQDQYDIFFDHAIDIYEAVSLRQVRHRPTPCKNAKIYLHPDETRPIEERTPAFFPQVIPSAHPNLNNDQDYLSSAYSSTLLS